MALPALDHLDRARFEWPESLVIDVIGACYGDTADDGEHRVAARLHARFLRALIDGETCRSGPLRVELIACCAARHIRPDAIAAADHAVFLELTTIVQSRFRRSPRLLRHFLRQLHDALGALLTRAKPATARDAPPRHGRALAFCH